MWYLSFSDWFISLSIMFSRFIHAVAKGKFFFFFWPIGAATVESSGYFSKRYPIKIASFEVEKPEF